MDKTQLLGLEYIQFENEYSYKDENKILNDASKYGLKTPPWLNKWGFTDNANLNNPPIDIVVIKASMDYIDRQFSSIKTINRKTSSYKIKHIVEKQIGQYVANGELIIAMINCGYDYKQWSINCPNCWFNVSQKSIDKARKR